MGIATILTDDDKIKCRELRKMQRSYMQIQYFVPLGKKPMNPWFAQKRKIWLTGDILQFPHTPWFIYSDTKYNTCSTEYKDNRPHENVNRTCKHFWQNITIIQRALYHQSYWNFSTFLLGLFISDVLSREEKISLCSHLSNLHSPLSMDLCTGVMLQTRGQEIHRSG